MPIYAYRCASCGHVQDVLQKLSDPLLTVCPACGEATYQKQLTAAGFQLKGSGWYATDFRGGNTPPKPDADAKEGAKPAEPAVAEAKAGSDAKAGDAKPAATPAAAPVAAAATAAKPAGGASGGAAPAA